MRYPRRIGLLSALAWSALAALQLGDQTRFTPVWYDLQAALAVGSPAWPAWQIWGLRCRWRCDAPEGRQVARDGCGPAALRAVLASRGCGAPQAVFWSICRLPRGGTTLGCLAHAATALGYACEVRTSRSFMDLPLPAIVHLRCGHFVVLETASPGCAGVLDPASGHLRVPWTELRRRGSGAVLILATAHAAASPCGCEVRA